MSKSSTLLLMFTELEIWTRTKLFAWKIFWQHTLIVSLLGQRHSWILLQPTSPAGWHQKQPKTWIKNNWKHQPKWSVSRVKSDSSLSTDSTKKGDSQMPESECWRQWPCCERWSQAWPGGQPVLTWLKRLLLPTVVSPGTWTWPLDWAPQCGCTDKLCNCKCWLSNVAAYTHTRMCMHTHTHTCACTHTHTHTHTHACIDTNYVVTDCPLCVSTQTM